MRRPERLAILPIGDKRLIHDLVGERDAAIDGGAVAALRQHPGRAAIFADEIDQIPKRNSGPFIGADQAMGVLHRQSRVGLLPILPAIARAFDEVHARDRWHRHEVVDRQDQRLVHHPMN